MIDKQPVDSALDGLILPERDQTIPAEQQGVFRKFSVKRVDGSDQPGGKHHGCEYFVLDTDHDAHAKPALAAYAESCKETHPELSKDMMARYGLSIPDLESIQQEYYKRGWKEAQEHYTKREFGTPSERELHLFTELGNAQVEIRGLRSALSDVQAGLWRPIETAPRDGTKINAYGASSDVGFEDDMRAGTCYWHDGRWLGGPFSSHCEPQFWQPFPEITKIEDGASK